MKLIYFKDSKGEWRWHIKARNGRIMADSGEGYKTRRGVLKAIGTISWLMPEPGPVISGPGWSASTSEP